MKKILFLGSLFSLISFITFSQARLSNDFTYSLGKPYQVVDAAEKYYFLMDNTMIKASLNKEVLTLQNFDLNNLSQLRKVIVKNFPAGFGWETMTVLNNKFYFFYNSYDKGKNTEQLMYRELNPDNLTFKGDDKILCSVKGKVTGELYNNGKMSYNIKTRDKFNFYYSYDTSKVLVQYSKKPSKGSSAFETIGLNTFDKDLNPIGTDEIKMPYIQKKMKNLHYSIDSEGNIYILSAVSNGNVDIKKCLDGKGESHLELLRIIAGTGVLEKVPVELSNFYIHNLTSFEGPGNYIVCAGSYSKVSNKKGNSIDGIFVFKAGKEGEIYDYATYEIPLEILNQNLKKKEQNKNTKKEKDDKAEFEDLIMQNVVINSDGSMLLVGEQQYKIITTRTSANGSVNVTVRDYYNDMLVTKIEADGKLAWMKKLPKKQQGLKGLGGMSYKYISGRDYHYFLFLDNVKNQGLTMQEVPAYHFDGQGGFLTAYKLNDESGEVSKDYIMDLRNVKGMEVFQFKTSRILSVSPTEFIVEVYKKDKKDILIKIDLKE